MSWKYVYNTHHMRGFKYLAKALHLASECGYDFILWKGEVLYIKSAESIGIKESELF